MTDDQAMQEVRKGNIQFLSLLFERRHVLLFNYFLRLAGDRAVSEDLVQDVFARILRYRASYRGEKGFDVWFFGIARNVFLDHLKRRGEAHSLEDEIVEAEDGDIGPMERVEKERQAAMVSRALEDLPLRTREIIVLSRYQNLKYREIADLLGCTETAVKVIIHRGIKTLGRAYVRLVKEAQGHDV